MSVGASFLFGHIQPDLCFALFSIFIPISLCLELLQYIYLKDRR